MSAQGKKQLKNFVFDSRIFEEYLKEKRKFVNLSGNGFGWLSFLGDRIKEEKLGQDRISDKNHREEQKTGCMETLSGSGRSDLHQTG